MTVTFEKELNDQASAPMLFYCNDFENYFCKAKLDSVNHDFLVYELIGSRLAKHFEISTPDVAIVQFDENSMANGFFQKNYNLKNGDLLFASKQIGLNDHIDKTGRFKIENRKQFDKLNNPKDILSTTLLDIHLNNSDRNEENYNLLFQTQQSKYYSIDHAALFGGPAMKGRFAPKGIPVLGNKLLNSYLLRNLLKFLSLVQIEDVVNNYFFKCNSSLGTEIESVFNSIPDVWVISDGLKNRVLDYSLDETRLELIQLLVMDRLNKIKKKL